MSIVISGNHPKYEIRICKCGTIHFIPDEKIQKALEENKDLLWICGSCGQATRIGADKVPNIYDLGPDSPEYVYEMYSMNINPNEMKDSISINWKDFMMRGDKKPLSEIFYNVGIKVPMQTGYTAKCYNHANQYFMDIWYPDWYKIERKDITKEEILEFIEQHKKDCMKVNMNLFIRQTPKQYLEILAQTWMPEFDWTGTEYESLHRQWMNRLHGKSEEEEN